MGADPVTNVDMTDIDNFMTRGCKATAKFQTGIQRTGHCIGDIDDTSHLSCQEYAAFKVGEGIPRIPNAEVEIYLSIGGPFAVLSIM